MVSRIPQRVSTVERNKPAKILKRQRVKRLSKSALESANVRKNQSVREVFLEKVMANDTMVELSYYQMMLSSAASIKRFYQGYFVCKIIWVKG